MDINNLLKILAAVITVVFAVVAGVIEIKKAPDYWLNRFFAMFFIFAAFGFLFYLLYHMILFSEILVIIFAIIGQVLFQISFGCLLMTEFILEYSQKRVMTPKYLLLSFGLSFLFSIGYTIWPITLNLEAYALGEVDTLTPDAWFIAVFAYRIAVMLFVLIKFILLSRKVSGKVKRQLKWFTFGMLAIIFGTFLTLLGGGLGVIFEIIGMFLFDLGALLILKGLIS